MIRRHRNWIRRLARELGLVRETAWTRASLSLQNAPALRGRGACPRRPATGGLALSTR